MQLLNSPQTRLETSLTGQLLDVLQDIVRKIEIRADFSIHHPDYKPLELPSEAVERFQKMPTQMQQKYLGLQLRSFLYGIYYNGSMQTMLALDGEGDSLPLNLENNTVLGVDVGFYKQLHESNFGDGYFDPGWSVLREESDGSLAVTKGGLRLHIERNRHLQLTEVVAVAGDSVAIQMPKNLVQNGFYMAVSNVASKSHENLVRVYFNFSPEGAVVVMGSLTRRLNAIPIFFHFKVLYNPDDYKRYDSGVLYFEKGNYEAVQQVLEVIYAENQSYFQPDVPLFTMQLAPGLGLAEEPDQKFGVQESFGMNRCQIVANGLLEAWQQGDGSPEGRMKAIFEQFSIFGIDLQCVYLNANSEDIYAELD